MKTILLRALAVAGLVLAITSPSQGFEGFLRMDGFKGESADQRYRDWIVVTAVSWGHQLPVATGADGGGRTVSRTLFQPLTVSKFVDSTSPGLAQIVGGGRYDNLTANFGKSEPAVGFVLDLDALASLLLLRNSGAMLTAQSERKSQHIINNDPTALFSEAIERRAQGERVVVDSGEVMP